MEDGHFLKIERRPLRDCGLNECWAQDRIAEDPTILGLGDLVVKDKERIQPKAGRLDLLLQDPETNRRYEVEVQLGRTDESHIIRTIEYWDLERKRYPMYEHTAVIVAEEISARFLNVISLFNGVIPLIAIRMSAVPVHDKTALLFTTVLDQMTLGLVDEDEAVHEATDRGYWERRATPATVGLADALLGIVREVAGPRFDLKYNKVYIGLAEDGQANNFVSVVPQKNALRLSARVEKSDDLRKSLEEAGLVVLGYDAWGAYNLRILQDDLTKRRVPIASLVRRAYEESGK
jgi:predicted transport protein